VLIGVIVIAAILGIMLAFMYLLLAGAPKRPRGDIRIFNEEMAKLIPVLREDTPLIIDQLEILRLGLSEKSPTNGENIVYTIYFGGSAYITDGVYHVDAPDDYQLKYSYISGGSFHYNYNFAENYDKFSVEEIDAINYLFFSDKLQLNVSAIHFYQDHSLWYNVVFAREGRFMLSIDYLDPCNDNSWLENSRHRGDYVEKLWKNYWIVMCFVEKS
jgi:hypothetical protein